MASNQHQMIATLGITLINNPDFVACGDDKPIFIGDVGLNNLIEVRMEGILYTYDREKESNSIEGLLTVWIDADEFSSYLSEKGILSGNNIYNKDIFEMIWEDFYWESNFEKNNNVKQNLKGA